MDVTMFCEQFTQIQSLHLLIVMRKYLLLIPEKLLPVLSGSTDTSLLLTSMIFCSLGVFLLEDPIGLSLNDLYLSLMVDS